MKKIILAFCAFSFFACEKQQTNFSDIYEISNVSESQVTMHFNLKFLAEQLNISEDYIIYSYNNRSALLERNFTENDSTIIFEVEGKFYEEKFSAGYSIMNKDNYALRQTFDNGKYGHYIFNLTKEYIQSLPEIEN